MEKRRMMDRHERSYNGITPETFQGYDADSKLNTLFDISIENHLCICDNMEAVEELRGKISKRRKVDTAVAGTAGFVGGFLAQTFKTVFKL